MDVTNLLADGEWLELETEHEDFGILKVKVIPRQYSGLIKMVLNDDMIEMLANLIVDWNLESEGKKIELTHENKIKYLSILAGWKIKNPRFGKKGQIFENVGTEIIAFAQDIKNFTKNSKPTLN